MAIQATEDATTFREWLLLGTALARVIEYLGPGSEDAAKELLLEYLHRGEIPWDCRRLDFGDGWTAETAHRFFFECHESVVHDVDWPNHRATRAGPVFMSVSAIGAKVLAYGPRTILTAREIILHWPSILRILQSFGAAPWSTKSPSLTEELPSESPAITPVPVSSTPSSQPETPKQKSAGNADTLKAWLPGAVERWPPDKTDTGGLDYIEFLQSKAPDEWARHSFQNELSLLRQTGVNIPPLDRTKKF